MLKLFESIHLDDLTTDFAPDDHAVPRTGKHATRLPSVQEGNVTDPFHLLKTPDEASSTESVRRGSRNRGPATKTDSTSTSRQRRSSARAEAFHRRRSANGHVLHASTSLAERSVKSRGYTGPLAGGCIPGDELLEVEIGDGCVRFPPYEQNSLTGQSRLAVSVYDSNGYKTVHRANICKDPAINNACLEAAQLVQAITPTFDTNQDRGKFKTYYFSLHRGSVKVCVPPFTQGIRPCNLPAKVPRMSKDVVENFELYEHLATVLEPVRKQAEGEHHPLCDLSIIHLP